MQDTCQPEMHGRSRRSGSAPSWKDSLELVTSSLVSSKLVSLLLLWTFPVPYLYRKISCSHSYFWKLPFLLLLLQAPINTPFPKASLIFFLLENSSAPECSWSYSYSRKIRFLLLLVKAPVPALSPEMYCSCSSSSSFSPAKCVHCWCKLQSSAARGQHTW